MTYKLNEAQAEATTLTNGNICVIASAGSGKTSCFSSRIAVMIRRDKIAPENILAVTFTKKATEEITNRVAKLIGKEATSRINIGTFHKVAYSIIRKFDPQFANHSTAPKLAPSWWGFRTICDIVKKPDKNNEIGLSLPLRPSELATFISYQKANLITIDDRVIINEDTPYASEAIRGSLQKAYRLYESQKKQSKMIDFDDMIFRLYLLLKNNDEAREEIQNQYKYVMIDEFQDTSTIVIEIVKMINDKNVFVVGDFRQSIYKFINARVENIFEFQDKFDDVKLIELDVNYRSTQNIVKFSNEIVGKSDVDSYSKYKPSRSVAEEGAPVKYTVYQRDTDQYEQMGKDIKERMDKGDKLSEIAVLVRTNAQTATPEQVFADMDIPYDVSKSHSFFDRKEVLDIISYARLAWDTSDDVSFERIYNSPNRYISKKLLSMIKDRADDGESLYNVAKKHFSDNRGIKSLIDVIDMAKNQIEAGVSSGKVVRNLVRMTRYENYVIDTSSSPVVSREKMDSIDKICAMSAKTPTIRAFLVSIDKIKDKQKQSQGKDAVQILTMHSAKGLEYDVVYIPDMIKDVMPHEMNEDKEEERRLFYVACSRPRKELFLSSYLYSFEQDKDSDDSILDASIFIKEMFGKDSVKKSKTELFKGVREASLLKEY